MAAHDLSSQVEKALDSIRPYLSNDGGGVSIIEITNENVVKVQLEGACQTCPQSYMTMKAGIEDTVKKAVPEISAVVAINQNQTNE